MVARVPRPASRGRLTTPTQSGSIAHDGRGIVHAVPSGEETGGPEKGVFVTYDLGAGVTAAGALVGPLPPNPRALVVIPTYNERESIGALLGEVRRVAAVDILVVDDRSPDGTAEAVTAVQAADAAVHLLVRSGRLGIAGAYLAGFDYAAREGYDLVFEMDADFSHPPRYLPVFLERIREADLVVGSRYVPGGGITSWSVLRRLISRGGNLYARTVLGSDLHDLTAGFKCFRVAALRRFDLSRIRSEGYCFQIELSYAFARNGFRVAEIPILFEERRAGQSKMSLGIVLESLTKVWALRFAPPTAALRPPPEERATARR
jgi:dolichol-phosphate mannosyltransferase